MLSWIDILQPSSETDKWLRLAAVLLLVFWNWTIATSIQTPYPKTLVEAYSLPLTRILLLLFVVFSAMWCPSVGILAAFAYIALGADVLFFTNKA